MRHRFAAAPWPRALHASTWLGAVVLCVLFVLAYRSIPVPTGFTHAFGLGVALVLPALLLGSLLFCVSGYAVEEKDLLVNRLLWSTRIALGGLTRAYADPAACKGALRVFGNAGLFGYTGVYRSPALGRFRLFATDIHRAVVLVLPSRTVVVTPASPRAFLHFVKVAFPTAEVPAGHEAGAEPV